MKKNPNNPSINVHEIEAILLAFQIWASNWQRQRVKVYTDSTTAFSGLQNFTFKGPLNAPLQEILFMVVK